MGSSQITETGEYQPNEPIEYHRPISQSVGGDDNSQRLGAGASAPKQTINFFGNKQNTIIGILLAANLLLGAALFYEWRNKQVAEDLHTFNAQQAEITLEVDKQLLAIMNCKR